MTTNSLALKAARLIRTFSLTNSFRAHPFTWYGSLCLIFIAWANYAQYQRLRPMYPDYAQYGRDEGGRMVTAKRQELADVSRYNQMVRDMRRDIGR